MKKDNLPIYFFNIEKIRLNAENKSLYVKSKILQTSKVQIAEYFKNISNMANDE